VALVVGAVAVFLNHISATLVFLPLYMFFIGLFAVGMGWIIAALQVYLRDAAQVMAVVLTLWFWLTPIFITESAYPSWARFIIDTNPMAYVVRAYRERLLSFNPPDLTELAILAAYAAATFLIGGLFFRHLKGGFADVL
jgi:ABC-type polysaccharide/polyol phosphate export permease